MKKLIIFLCLIHLNIIAISQSIIIGKNFSKGISVELISRLDTTRILSGGIEYFNDNKEWGISFPIGWMNQNMGVFSKFGPYFSKNENEGMTETKDYFNYGIEFLFYPKYKRYNPIIGFSCQKYTGIVMKLGFIF